MFFEAKSLDGSGNLATLAGQLAFADLTRTVVQEVFTVANGQESPNFTFYLTPPGSNLDANRTDNCQTKNSTPPIAVRIVSRSHPYVTMAFTAPMNAEIKTHSITCFINSGTPLQPIVRQVAVNGGVTVVDSDYRITAISPRTGIDGVNGSLDLTVEGTWAEPGVTISGGVGVSSVSQPAANTIRVTYTIPNGTSLGTKTVTLTSGSQQKTTQFHVVPRVTIQEVTGVPKGGSRNFSVTLSQPTPGAQPVQLKLTTTSGSGSATFSSGSTTIQMQNSNTALEVKGVLESDQVDNIKLTVNPFQETNRQPALAEELFSVVWVTLSLRTNGPVSADNSQKAFYESNLTPPLLGQTIAPPTANRPFSVCSIGAEIIGTVKPAAYPHPVILRRTAISGYYYTGQEQTINAASPPEDTSLPGFRDDDPQSGGSGGKVYDLDGPGPGGQSSTEIYRLRINLAQYAVLDLDSNTVLASDVLEWFSASSCQGGTHASDVANDNQAGLGHTNTNWNLQ